MGKNFARREILGEEMRFGKRVIFEGEGLGWEGLVLGGIGCFYG